MRTYTIDLMLSYILIHGLFRRVFVAGTAKELKTRISYVFHDCNIEFDAFVFRKNVFMKYILYI
jgi:hypothetical protein